MLRTLWNRLPPYFKNRYSISIILFCIWMAFFDQNDLISQFSLRMELSQLEKDKAYFEREIKQTEADLAELLSDDKKLERFAREKYYMKKPNEEIFVIVAEE